MKLKTHYSSDTYSVLLVENDFCVAVANAFKLGKKWHFNTSIKGVITKYDTFEEAKAAVLRYKELLGN